MDALDDSLAVMGRTVRPPTCLSLFVSPPLGSCKTDTSSKGRERPRVAGGRPSHPILPPYPPSPPRRPGRAIRLDPSSCPRSLSGWLRAMALRSRNALEWGRVELSPSRGRRREQEARAGDRARA